MAEPSYIQALRVLNNRVDRDFTIDLTPPEGREFLHLILTGKNGSGKTSTLAFLADELQNHGLTIASWWLSGGSSSPQMPAQVQRSLDEVFGPELLGVLPLKSGPAGTDARQRVSCLMLPARRKLALNSVSGPTTLNSLAGAPKALEQLLVNLRTQVAYAREELDEQSATQIEARIDQIERTLASLFDEPVRLEFNRKKLRYGIYLGDRKADWNRLPDGFASALEIWLRIQAAVEGWEGERGVVLIDELEAHLHLALQEKLLPLLTGLFPRVQFIVATHSPAVIASIDGAVVYDLSAHAAVRSDELRGVRYGTLMTGHFGISSDFDLKSTAELQELKRLRDNRARSPEEELRMRALASRLGARSHTLALEVWNLLERTGT